METIEEEVSVPILRECHPPAQSAMMIGNLANQFHYIHQSTKIRDLSEELKNQTGIWAVAVVDDEFKPVGVLTTAYLQSQLSRPFGQEILNKRSAVELTERTRSFDWDKHVFTVADKLKDEVQSPTNNYHLLVDKLGHFAGIFSTKDLLIYQFNSHRQDLTLAVKLQEALVPENASGQASGLEYLTYSNPAKGVGGDYYGLKEYKNHHWVFTVCDVSGKGIAASLVTTALGGMFGLFDFTRGLKRFIEGVNRFVLNTFHMEKYLTGVFLDYNAKTRELIFFDMGHTYFYVFRQGKFVKSQPLNPFVGFLPNLEPKGQKIQLDKGDLVVVLTDGFVEQQNPSGQEFGLARIEKMILQHSHEALPDLKVRVHKAVKEFRGDAPRGDDETLLFLRIV